MKKSTADLRAFQKALLDWFRQFQRDLPWRRTKDPYRIWVSEIMLQQTRVAAVIPYYERFLERFPDVHTLAEAPDEEVLRLWAGLGYYSRARNLHEAARQIVGLHGGEFPRNEEAVHALAGIGRYTGAAILSIAFGARVAVLDGNVARVLARLHAIRGDLREGARWQSLQKTANDLLDAEAPGDWNQAMMELGATICTPRAPQCLLCPVAKFCKGRRLGEAEAYPEKRKKRAAVEIVLAAAVFCDGCGQTLLLPPPTRNEPKPAADHVPTLVSGMWHFPTIAVRKDPWSELRKLIGRELGVRVADGSAEQLKPVRHAVTYRSIRAIPFRITLPKLPKIAGARAIALTELSELAVSNLTRKIARVVAGQAAVAPSAEPASTLLAANG